MKTLIKAIVICVVVFAILLFFYLKAGGKI